jgi:hypothetical protein
MHKNIKNIYRISLALFLTVILLPVLTSVLLLLPTIQTKVAQYFTRQLSETYHTTISVDKVYLTPLGNLLLENVLVRDQKSDSLLFIKEIKGAMSHISISNHKVEFRKITLNQPLINIKQLSEGYNFDFLLKNQDTTKTSDTWMFQTNRIIVESGDFRMQRTDTTRIFPRIDLQNIHINNINLHCSDLFLSKDSTTINISQLSFSDQGGFKIDSSSLGFKNIAGNLLIDKLNIKTDQSFIKAERLNFTPDTSKAKNPFNAHFDIKLDSSMFAPIDLLYFSNWANNLNSPLALSGNFYGSVANLNGKDVALSFGQQSVLETTFNLVGLPKIEETFLYIDITNLLTRTSDINLLLSGIPRMNFTGLPDSFDQLGDITYKGNFTGFINDLVAYGKFSTRLGNIKTDLGIKVKEGVTFSGSLNTSGFQIGRMVGAENSVGQITMKMEMNGFYGSNENYFAHLKGTIDSVSVRNHKYQAININGLLANRKFDGQFDMNDPDASVNFSGNIDFSQLIPNYNFYARVRHLNLEELKFGAAFAKTSVNFDIISNFEASSVNDLVGFIRMDGLNIVRDNKQFAVDSIVVSAIRKDESKQLSLRSDLLQGEIKGKYNFKHLKQMGTSFLGNFLPAVTLGLEKDYQPLDNDFTFHFELRKFGQLLNFFNPSIQLSNAGNIEGSFNNYKKHLLLDCEIPQVKIANFDAENLLVHVNTTDKLNATYSFDNLKIFNLINITNFTIQQAASNNQLSTNLLWNSWSEITNSGAIFTNTTFSVPDSGLVSSILVESSQMIVNDTVWNIKPVKITTDPNGFEVDNFRIWHNNQQFTINGRVDKRGNDGLSGYIRNLNLAQVLRNVKLGDTKLAGVVDAEFLAKDLFIRPSLIGELSIDDLVFNGALMGRLEATSEWGAQQKALVIKTNLTDGGNEKMNGICEYSIDQQRIDLSADLNRLDIDFLMPWLDAVMLNVKGKASGKLYLNGSTNSPVLTAKLKLEDGKFDVPYLKTTYSISDSVTLEPQRIVFHNMSLKDKHNHKGVFKGYIAHNQFSGLSYNLIIECNNLLALDTKQKDNPLFFGTVYTTGTMKISGVTSMINIDIAAKTMPNTFFNIPIHDETELKSNEFIQFIDKTNKEQSSTANKPKEYEIDLSGIEMNMDIEATPDAKVQIIFDQRTGEILNGNGSGDIQIKIDKASNLSMFGNYNIEEGGYIFSFQNIIKKKFSINRGSSLKWDGNPFNAMLNVNASYKVKASLYDLMGYMGSSASEDLKKRIPLNCNLLLSDRLSKPTIQFDIEVQSVNQSESRILKEYIRSEEEMNRQVLSLLVLNRFYSSESQKTNEQSSSNPALNTTTEMLSNRLSNWLSQINEDVDVNVKYRAANEITTSQDIEVALSTQLFNDRVSISTNVGYEEYQTTSKNNGFIGDFDMNVKLNKSGTVRAHAYTHTNNDILYTTTSPTKQGVGISFREEYNSWNELWNKYMAIIFGDKRKKKAQADTVNQTSK